MKGICLLTWIPIRSKPESGAEMVSSLLFGETYTVTEQQKDWIRILTDFDAYEGWISAAQNEQLEESHKHFDTPLDLYYLNASSGTASMLIPCGAMLPADRHFDIGGLHYAASATLKNHNHLPMRLKVTVIAQHFLNAPYLWGGRCFAGIDCSGLVQVAYKVNGIALPRDTSKQVAAGTPIAFNELDIADLIFFQNDEGSVCHVGLYLGKGNILHASGRVRIDAVDETGIRKPDGSYSHQFLSCRRIL